MQYLIGTDAVHTTAAICDYLDGRATAADTVVAVSVVPPDEPDVKRDCQEALNVASVRLVAIDAVETELREGEPAAELLAAADEWDADEVLICVHSASPGAATGLGSTAQALLERASLPVVVVPTQA